MSQIGAQPELIETPALAQYDTGALIQLPVVDVPSGPLDATWHSDANTSDNGVLEYSDETGFAVTDKVELEEFELLEGFGFTHYRREKLPIPAAGRQDEQLARTRRRFDLWEPYAVEKAIAEYLDTTATDVGAIVGDSEEGLAILLAASVDEFPWPPIVHTGRPAGVLILRRGSAKASGVQLVVGSGYGISDDGDGHGRMYLTGPVQIRRGPVVESQAVDATGNRIDTLIEREYFVVLDGPAFRVDVSYATPETP